MKVLMVTSDHQMIDRRIIQEAKTLIAAGHDVQLLAGFECEQNEVYEDCGIKIERFTYNWADSRFNAISYALNLGSNGWVFRKLSLLFKAWVKFCASLSSFEHFVLEQILKQSFDVLHVHDFPMLKVGVRAAKIRGVPLIYDAHEIYYAQAQLPVVIQKRYRRTEKKYIRFPDVVITVNPFIAQLMADRYRIKTPNVILNAGEVRDIIDKNRLRRDLGWSADIKIVLYQGWISDNRGLDILVKASKYFNSNVRLVLIGYGSYLKDLKALVKCLGVDAKVCFFGGVPSENLHDLTASADLGVIPYFGVDDNNHYCSPNKLFEFIVAEIPCLANDLPFLRSIIEHYKMGQLVNLRNEYELAKAVNQLTSSPEDLAILKEGTALAKKDLNWTVEGEKLLNIYQKILT